MEKTKRAISLTCPVCNKTKTTSIPEEIFSQKSFKSIKIQIPSGIVCPDHQFIVFLNNKGKVLGYERIDILVGNKTKEIIKGKSKDKEGDTLNLNILVDKFGLYGFLSIIHAQLFSYPVYIVRKNIKDKFLQQLNIFFDDIIKKELKASSEIEIIGKIDYDDVDLEKKDVLLINEYNNIMQTPWDEKLKLEEDLVEKALGMFNPETQTTIIKQNIEKFIKQVNLTINFIEDKEEVYDDDIIKKLKTEFKKVKIDKERVKMIKKYIIRNISRDLGKKIKNIADEFLSAL
jgi:hypothetical protein